MATPITLPSSGAGISLREPGTLHRWPISPRVIGLSLLITLLLGLASFRVTTSTTSGFLAWSDGLAYFLYARSLVIDGNSDITNEYDELDKLYPIEAKSGTTVMDSIRVNTKRNPRTGHIYSPWPVGAGVLMSPFYAIGYTVEQVLAKTQGRAANSYGLVPQYFFAMGSLLLGLLGFWATLLCCREVAETKWSYAGALAAVLGGPAVFYMFVNPTMAHAMSFGLVAVLTLLWLRQWTGRVTFGRFALSGLLLGILISIRFQNVFFGLLPLTLLLREGVRDSWVKAAGNGLAAAAAGLAPLLIQAAHAINYGPPSAAVALQKSGILMIGSYPIHLKSPFFLEVLFSCRHGAFHWAPLLLLGVVGLIWLTRHRHWAGVFLLIILCNVYLIGAIGITDLTGGPAVFDTANWNDHWKGGTSFGMRYLTECTPFFAVGIAAILQATGGRIGKWFWPGLLLVLIMWNSLLILSYGLGTVSRTSCVPYGQMIAGVGEALAKVTAKGLGK